MTITVTAVGQTDGEVLFVDTEVGVWKDPTTTIPAATDVASGLMAAAEHTKLDGIEEAATAAGAAGDAFAVSHPGGNQHIDWTVDQGATNIHDGNIVIPAVKLDDAVAPDDNTDLNATTSAHGLLLKATAPAAGLVNVVGIANGETAYTNKALFDTTNPADLGTAGPGTAVTAARRDHVHAAWDGDIADINLDGGTDVGGALTGTDLILVDAGANGTNCKSTLSRVATYIDASGIATSAASSAVSGHESAYDHTKISMGLFTEAASAPTGIAYGHRWVDTTSDICYTYIANSGNPTWVEL